MAPDLKVEEWITFTVPCVKIIRTLCPSSTRRDWLPEGHELPIRTLISNCCSQLRPLASTRLSSTKRKLDCRMSQPVVGAVALAGPGNRVSNHPDPPVHCLLCHE